MKVNHESNVDQIQLDAAQNIFALRHLVTGEFICLRHEANEHLACFTDADSAFQFREELGLLEHVSIVPMFLGQTPFDHFWLDGQMIAQPLLINGAARR